MAGRHAADRRLVKSPHALGAFPNFIAYLPHESLALDVRFRTLLTCEDSAHALSAAKSLGRVSGLYCEQPSLFLAINV